MPFPKFPQVLRKYLDLSRACILQWQCIAPALKQSQPEGESRMEQLVVKMFGNPFVSAAGQKVTFSYRKADALLYYMLVKKRAARGELAGLLWEESDAGSALKNLRHAIYTIRKGLGMEIFSAGQLAVLELDPKLSIQCDLYEFLEKGELSAYQGEFLEGFSLPHAGLFDEWLTEQRNLLHTQYLKRLLAEEKEAFRMGDLIRAEQLGLKYVRTDPLEESAAVILMELYSAQKKYRKAIGIYHELCRNLSQELSISPLKETTALYYRIVNEWNSSTYKMEEQSYRLLVGKEGALRCLLAMCNGPAAERRVSCTVIEGESGVGKTYLLDHVLNYYDFSDWLVCRSYCYQSESGTPLSPWNAIMMALMAELELRKFTVPENYLKTAAGLFPCLSASVGQDYADADWNYPLQQNYHVALESTLLIIAAVSKRFPLLLVFEDIHWMDKNSAELLGIVLRRMRNLNVTVICTSRDICPEHIRAFLDSAQRDHIVERCPIHSFTREETLRFVQHHLDRELPPEVLERIYESTGGNALQLVQLATSLRERPDLSELEPTLNNLIGYRLSHLTLEERQVLDLISVFPDWAPFDAISAILTRDPLDLMYICSRLKQRAMVQELNREGSLYYALAHDQIRSTLLGQQSESARRILHLRVAQNLESRMGHTQIFQYDRLVYHYCQGGNRFKAFQYKVLSLNAYTGSFYAVLPTLTEGSDTSEPQNISYYFRALEQELSALRAGMGQKGDLDDLESILLHSKASYCVYVGDYKEGLAALGRLVELCSARGNTQMLIRAHLQYIYYGIQIWDTAVMEEHLAAGMALLGDQEQSEEYGIYLRMEGLLQTMLGQYERSRETLLRSIDTLSRLAQSRGDDRYAINIAGAYNYIAENYRIQEDYDQAFLAYDQAIIYNRSRGYYPGAAVFYTNYGVAAFEKGEREIARQLFLFALETYRASHEYSGKPIALSYLAFYQAEEGHLEQAADYIQEAHQVSDRIRSPWWKGITLYQCWKIRQLLDERGIEAARLRSLWPQDPIQHCRQCLFYLNQMGPRQESREMEGVLRQLEEQKQGTQG